MTVINCPMGINRPLLIDSATLTNRLTTEDLPAAYLDLLAEKNGGYLQNMCLPTPEPTSDGLDYGLIHYIFGLHHDPETSILHQQRHDLPDYFVIFSANEQQLFAFDYANQDVQNQPAIRHLDIETDNWQIVAPNFQRFLEMLQPYQLTIPLEGKLTRHEVNHAFLLVDDADFLEELWLHVEDWEDKEWLLGWLEHFTKHPKLAYRRVTLAALEVQLLYFRLSFPSSGVDLLNRFLADEDEGLRKQAEALVTELAEV